MAQYLQKSIDINLQKDSVVFFGTGPVSLQSLNFISRHYAIEAVVTQPDRRTHGKTIKSPVKDWAESNSVEFFQPSDAAELDKILEERAFFSLVGIVVDFGMILSQHCIDSFPRGIINSHFSLLPKWRGADPITFSILSGQRETGVSLMQLARGLDTGDIIDTKTVKITADETTLSLTDKLNQASNDLLESNLAQIFSGDYSAEPQHGIPTFSRKLTKADGKINWTKPAKQIQREIRAYIGWPGSFTNLDKSSTITIVKSSIDKPRPGLAPGTCVQTPDGSLAFVCGDKSLLVAETIKPSGKNIMSSKSFLNGKQHLRDQLTVIEQED